MAILTGALTLADIRSRMEPGEMRYAKIIEALEETNEILEDMPWLQGNLQTGHRAVIRTGLPSATWRRLNKGVQPTKSTTAQVDFTCGMLAARIETDKTLAELGGDVAGARMSELKAHIMGMSNDFTDVLFYGDRVANPLTDFEKFEGFASFYKDNTTAQSRENIITAGGSQSDNASIWLIGWGEETIHGIYPKGMKAGLQHEDLGVGDAFDSNQNRFRAYMDSLEWHCGLAVKDWRFAVRIANIDVSNLESTAANRQALINLMTAAVEKLPNRKACKPVFYTNAKVRTALRIGLREEVKAGGGLTYDNVAGKPVLNFDGIPIKRCDALLNTEAVVS